VGGDAADAHPAGAVLDEYQDVQPGQCDSVHVQEVDGQDPGASNSAFFARSPRITRIARLNNQRISRQMILSSTWSANHHRTTRAG
jgi:hypothetical protein